MRRGDLGREEVDHHDDIDDICPCFQGRRASLDDTIDSENCISTRSKSVEWIVI